MNPAPTIEDIHSLMDNLSVGLVVHSSDSSIFKCNRAAVDILGLMPEQIIGKQAVDLPLKFIHEDMSAMSVKDYPVSLVLSSGIPLKEYLVGIIGSDKNTITWVISSATPIFSQSGEIVEVIVKLTDITKYKKVEQELKASTEKFRVMYDNAPLCYQSLDINGCFIDVNPTWQDVLGYTREEVLGKNFSDFLHPDWNQHFDKNFTSFKELGFVHDVQFKIRHKNNQYLCVSFEGRVAFNSDGSFKQTHCVFKDITDRKLAEELLKESEERFRLFYENSPDMHASVSAVDATILSCNKTLLDNTGYSRSEVVGSPVFSLYHPDSLSDAKDTFNQFANTGNLQDKKLVFKRKDGSKLHTSLNVNAIRDDTGKILYSISSWRDISQWLKAEEAVRTSENKFRTVFENRGTATGLFDENGIIKDCNSVFVEMSGYSRDEIIDKKKWSDLVYKEDLARLWKYHSERGASDSSAPAQYECRVCSKQGKLMDAILNVAMVGEIRIVSLIDISEHKKAESEIRRMQKLEGLGTVAGGIAHDFNNLLTGVFGNLEMARHDLPTSSPSCQYLEEAHNAIQSARRLTGQLLTFAKGGAPVFESVETAELIRGTIEFNLHGSNVISEIKLPDNLWPVKADRGQIEQVIANLTINSKQAMPGGGVLHLEARNYPVRTVSGESDMKCDSVVITIRDEGTGIPYKIINNIFDPYFTTKDQGHGLGLAIVHSIIAQHSGHIRVDSTVNEGATFTITLPAVPPAETKETAKSFRIEKATDPKSTLHILIMDDEPMVRSIAEQLLQRIGHTTDTAVEGDEAIRKYTLAIESNSPFDLIIMDLTIRGGKGGKQTIKELLEIYPGAKVIVSSGYASGPIMADYTAYGFAGKLAKPFTVSDLRDEITRVVPFIN